MGFVITDNRLGAVPSRIAAENKILNNQQLVVPSPQLIVGAPIMDAESVPIVPPPVKVVGAPTVRDLPVVIRGGGSDIMQGRPETVDNSGKVVTAGQGIPDNIFDFALGQENPVVKWGLILGGVYIAWKSYQNATKPKRRRSLKRKRRRTTG